MDNESSDRLTRLISRIGIGTFAASIFYGVVLHGPFVWWWLSS